MNNVLQYFLITITSNREIGYSGPSSPISWLLCCLSARTSDRAFENGRVSVPDFTRYHPPIVLLELASVARLSTQSDFPCLEGKLNTLVGLPSSANYRPRRGGNGEP